MKAPGFALTCANGFLRSSFGLCAMARLAIARLPEQEWGWQSRAESSRRTAGESGLKILVVVAARNSLSPSRQAMMMATYRQNSRKPRNLAHGIKAAHSGS